MDGTAVATRFGKCVLAELHRRIAGVPVPQPMPRRASREIRVGGRIPARPAL